MPSHYTEFNMIRLYFKQHGPNNKKWPTDGKTDKKQTQIVKKDITHNFTTIVTGLVTTVNNTYSHFATLLVVSTEVFVFFRFRS